MKKLFLIAALFAIGIYFALDGLWMMRISAFGYEISFSALLLIIAFSVLLYVLRLLGKPAQWVQNYRTHKTLKNATQKTDFWQLILTTVLDKNDENRTKILKNAKDFFKKNTLDTTLLEAIFNPTPSTFEQLLKHPNTKLAGLRGLILEAEKQGDLNTQEKLLLEAATNYPTVSWIACDLLTVQLMQDNPTDALKTLEKLNQKKWIDRSDYTLKKAEILFQLKRYQEAYTLSPDNPMMALAYARSNSKKEKEILSKTWALTPDWDIYEAFRKAISTLPIKKQETEMNRFLNANQAGGLYLIAAADNAIQQNEWATAKENLQAYLNGYSLTRQVALMMAKIEADGYHHAERAREWFEKSEAL